jgi:hypothetical protein
VSGTAGSSGTVPWTDALWLSDALNDMFGRGSAVPEHRGDGRFAIRVKAGGESAVVPPGEAGKWLAGKAPAAAPGPGGTAAGPQPGSAG